MSKRAWWLGAVVLLAGCGADPGAADLAPVEGTVYLNDQPLADAVVTFTPAGSTKGVVSTGRTGADGRYTLKTVRGHEGAAVGEHKVVISKLVLPDGSALGPDAGVGQMDSQAKELLPAAYSSAEQTTLTATVKTGGPPLDFRLKAEKKAK
jgi:hypothetical protein